MLEQKDLEVLRQMMESVVDKRIAETEERMGARIAETEERMGARIAESEKRMESMMDKKISEAENILLEEIDRTQTNLENKIDLVKRRLEELNQYYEISKLENGNISLVLKMIEKLEERVEELERKTA